jgi:hypothetical protein
VQPWSSRRSLSAGTFSSSRPVFRAIASRTHVVSMVGDSGLACLFLAVLRLCAPVCAEAARLLIGAPSLDAQTNY